MPTKAALRIIFKRFQSRNEEKRIMKPKNNFHEER